MKLILNDGTKVEGTLEELLDFLKEYKKLTKNGIKIEPIYPYPDYPINPITHPQVWYGLSGKNDCEGCPIYEKLKKGETVIGDGCYWCGKYPYKATCDGTPVKLTMDTTNNLDKQPFNEYASGLPIREAMTGKKTYTADEANALLKKYGMLNEDGTVVDEYRGNMKETDK